MSQEEGKPGFWEELMARKKKETEPATPPEATEEASPPNEHQEILDEIANLDITIDELEKMLADNDSQSADLKKSIEQRRQPSTTTTIPAVTPAPEPTIEQTEVAPEAEATVETVDPPGSAPDTNEAAPAVTPTPTETPQPAESAAAEIDLEERTKRLENFQQAYGQGDPAVFQEASEKLFNNLEEGQQAPTLEEFRSYVKALQHPLNVKYEDDISDNLMILSPAEALTNLKQLSEEYEQMPEKVRTMEKAEYTGRVQQTYKGLVEKKNKLLAANRQAGGIPLTSDAAETIAKEWQQLQKRLKHMLDLALRLGLVERNGVLVEEPGASNE